MAAAAVALLTEMGKIEIHGARWVSSGEVLLASYRTVVRTHMKA
jgi:hypothetical protein